MSYVWLPFMILWLGGVAGLTLWARRKLAAAKVAGRFDYGLGWPAEAKHPAAFRVQMAFHYFYVALGSLMFVFGLVVMIAKLAGQL